MFQNQDIRWTRFWPRLWNSPDCWEKQPRWKKFVSEPGSLAKAQLRWQRFRYVVEYLGCVHYIGHWLVRSGLCVLARCGWPLVVIVAPSSTNQSQRSKFSLDQSESSILPMWLIDVTNAHIWAWFYTWPHGIKNTRTQELNLHSLHSFNDRVKPGYKRDVCDAQVTSRPWYYWMNKRKGVCLLEEKVMSAGWGHLI